MAWRVPLVLVGLALASVADAMDAPVVGELLSRLGRGRGRASRLDAASARLVDELLAAKPVKERLQFHAVPIKPMLNFALRHQAGYYFAFPYKQFEGAGNRVLVVLRVKPLDREKPAVYWTRMFTLPRVPSGNKAAFQGGGGFAVGPGKYEVDLALVDTQRRWNRKHWQIEAQRSQKAKDIALDLGPGEVQFADQLRWREDVPRAAGENSRLTILLHAAPARYRSIKLQGFDQMMLLSSLSSIMATRPFAHVRLIAFNLDQQRKLYEKEEFDFRGFQDLARVLGELQLGTVSYDVLARREGHVDLMADVLRKEMDAEQRADAVLVLGPTTRYYGSWKREVCEGGGPALYYFQYRPLWNLGAEFPDTIEHLMRACAGKTFRIHTPADLEVALGKLVRTSAP